MAEKVYAIWDIGQEPGGAEETAKKAGKEVETVPGGGAGKVGGGVKTAKITFLTAENKADMQKGIRELYGSRTTVYYVKEANLEE